eukprot:6213567-Pleurochrysis_carterae.AAC.2
MLTSPCWLSTIVLKLKAHPRPGPSRSVRASRRSRSRYDPKRPPCPLRLVRASRSRYDRKRPPCPLRLVRPGSVRASRRSRYDRKPSPGERPHWSCVGT